jgi:hypothetical protein
MEQQSLFSGKMWGDLPGRADIAWLQGLRLRPGMQQGNVWNADGIAGAKPALPATPTVPKETTGFSCV